MARQTGSDGTKRTDEEDSDLVAVCEDCGAEFKDVELARGHTDLFTCENLTPMGEYR